MNLIKSTGTFSFFTLISRLLGYIRDILIAIFLEQDFWQMPSLLHLEFLILLEDYFQKELLMPHLSQVTQLY